VLCCAVLCCAAQLRVYLVFALGKRRTVNYQLIIDLASLTSHWDCVASQCECLFNSPFDAKSTGARRLWV